MKFNKHFMEKIVLACPVFYPHSRKYLKRTLIPFGVLLGYYLGVPFHMNTLIYLVVSCIVFTKKTHTNGTDETELTAILCMTSYNIYLYTVFPQRGGREGRPQNNSIHITCSAAFPPRYWLIYLILRNDNVDPIDSLFVADKNSKMLCFVDADGKYIMLILN